jgi:hypothetical protein
MPEFWSLNSLTISVIVSSAFARSWSQTTSLADPLPPAFVAPLSVSEPDPPEPSAPPELSVPPSSELPLQPASPTVPTTPAVFRNLRLFCLLSYIIIVPHCFRH